MSCSSFAGALRLEISAAVVIAAALAILRRVVFNRGVPLHLPRPQRPNGATTQEIEPEGPLLGYVIFPILRWISMGLWRFWSTNWTKSWSSLIGLRWISMDLWRFIWSDSKLQFFQNSGLKFASGICISRPHSCGWLHDPAWHEVPGRVVQPPTGMRSGNVDPRHKFQTRVLKKSLQFRVLPYESSQIHWNPP